jgi:hypothetical protein
VGDGRCEIGGRRSGTGWQGWRVRFPARKVTLDFSFTLLFLFDFLAATCFDFVFFPFLSFPVPSLSLVSSHESYFCLFLFSDFQIFKVHRPCILWVASGQCFIEQEGVSREPGICSWG